MLTRRCACVVCHRCRRALAARSVSRLHEPQAIPLSKALKEWEAKSGTALGEAREVLLHGGLTSEAGKKVFIGKLDGGAAGAGARRACVKLSHSTNQVRARAHEARVRARAVRCAARDDAGA